MKKNLVFLTGAGVSAESGFSTFRDSGGLWEQYDVEQVASIEGYIRNPELVINFYNERRSQLRDAQPNEAHRLIASLEDQFNVTVITQNVDDLHERAGSSHVVHLHGELTKCTSTRSPNDPSQIVRQPLDVPVRIGDKARDGSQLRPFIVWFGEAVPEMERAIEFAEQADIFVVIGTSLNVYPAAGLVHYTRRRIPKYLIDPKPVAAPGEFQHIVLPATSGMAQLAAQLREA